MGTLATNIIAGLPTRILIIDVEVYEMSSKELLEIGFVIIQTTDKAEVRVHHYWITDNAHLRNERYCESNSTSFAYGITKKLSQAETVNLLQHEVKLTEDCGENGVVCGHAITNDLK